MINAKATLQNLHQRFPEMSLDDLFAILECITEDYGTWISTGNTYWEDPILGPKIY